MMALLLGRGPRSHEPEPAYGTNSVHNVLPSLSYAISVTAICTGNFTAVSAPLWAIKIVSRFLAAAFPVLIAVGFFFEASRLHIQSIGSLGLVIVAVLAVTVATVSIAAGDGNPDRGATLKSELLDPPRRWIIVDGMALALLVALFAGCTVGAIFVPLEVHFGGGGGWVSAFATAAYQPALFLGLFVWLAGVVDVALRMGWWVHAAASGIHKCEDRLTAAHRSQSNAAPRPARLGGRVGRGRRELAADVSAAEGGVSIQVALVNAQTLVRAANEVLGLGLSIIAAVLAATCLGLLLRADPTTEPFSAAVVGAAMAGALLVALLATVAGVGDSFAAMKEATLAPGNQLSLYSSLGHPRVDAVVTGFNAAPLALRVLFVAVDSRGAFIVAIVLFLASALIAHRQ